MTHISAIFRNKAPEGRPGIKPGPPGQVRQDHTFAGATSPPHHRKWCVGVIWYNRKVSPWSSHVFWNARG